MNEAEKQFNPSEGRPVEEQVESREGIVFWNSPSGTVESGTQAQKEEALEKYREN